MHFVFVEGRNNKTTFAVYNMLEGYCYIIFIILIAREREKNKTVNHHLFLLMLFHDNYKKLKNEFQITKCLIFKNEPE